MAGFETIYDQARALGIEGEMWINGSFLTRSIEPSDVDFILITDPKFRDQGTAEQADFIEWLINKERDPEKSFQCDTDVVFRYPQDSPWYEHFTGSVLRHWEQAVFGKSVSSGEPKGIVVVSLKETSAPSATSKQQGTMP